jgi:hypothetical protein
MAYPKVTKFGIMSGSRDTLHATWSWTYKNTDHYIAKWSYDTGNGKWIVGAENKKQEQQDTYVIPANAVRIRFQVLPVSETYTVNGTQRVYWTASWSTTKTFNISAIPPIKPPAPSVNIDGTKLTTKLENYNEGVTIQFEIIQNESKVYRTATASIKNGVASYSLSIPVGYTYKVRCRSKTRSSDYSEWSNYSTEINTKPLASLYLTTCQALSETSVKLVWNESKNAETYEIEYSTNKDYLGQSNATTKLKTENKNTTYIVTGLNTGEEYFFRVRAVNEKGESDWGYINSVILGTKPDIPTTWSSSSTAMIGEEVNLYWVHNSKDNSKEINAELQLSINGTTTNVSLGTPNTADDYTRSYKLDTKSYGNDTSIDWRIRTKGVTGEWSDWSVNRTVKVFTAPTLSLIVTDYKDEVMYTMETFPVIIHAEAGPITQKPISYHVSILANESYEEHDEIGNFKMISKGDEVYSSYFDTSSDLTVSLTPADVKLENNISYTVKCIVGMDSGLNAEAEFIFDVAWEDAIYYPDAEIIYDPESVALHIKPYCDFYPDILYKVIYNHETGEFFRTDTILSDISGAPINESYTEIYGDVVYYGTEGKDANSFYCVVVSDEPELFQDVTLSVYRREYDGRFTEIETGIANIDNAFVTDPHPSLDYGRYRIVAVDDKTGAISFSDIPEYAIGEKTIIIQWEENMIRLPYNIDISDTNSPDVSLVNYIGRSHPVSYYGTHLDSSATWKADIIKSDVDTLYALRRLANYMGDVYVREPSGSGYWANITIKFDQTHNDPVIPVTMDIKRVEGGI